MEPALFTEDVLERKVAVVGSELVENYTVYIIEVTDGMHRWTVKHRYSDFHELHEKLTAENKVDRRLLPPKKMLGKNSKSLVERRQKELEQYLQTLLMQFPQATPTALSSFLHLHLYEINGITAALAEELFHKGEQLLQDGQVFTLRPLQLYSVSQQLKLAKPTCFTGDAKADLGHILDFTCRLKYLKVSGTQGPVGSSNIKEYSLPFDLSICKSLLQIEISECSSQQITGLSSLRQTLATMSIHHTTESMASVLVPEAIEFPQWEPEGAVPVCPVTAVIPVWRSLTTLDLSHNSINEVDSSVKLIPKVEFLDLSHNQLSSVKNLQHLYSLVHVDLSYNLLSSLEAAHTRLGNIKTLGLSGNQLSSLQGLSKLYSLVNLDLSHNQLTQLEEIKNIGSLPCLEKLNLSNNPMCIIPDYRTKVLAQFGDRAAEVCLDGKTTTEKELDTVEVLKAIQKAKEMKDRKNNSTNTNTEKKPALPSQALTSSREETAVAPSVLPKTEALPPQNTTNLHMTAPAATIDQGEHCGAPSASVCHICSPPSLHTDPSCFFCSAPYCPLLSSQLLSLSSHKDFISQLSVWLSSALNGDITEKREELQKQEEEPNNHQEKTELYDTSPDSRDGYFEMGLDDSVEESSSTSSLPVSAPSLPVEVEEVLQGAPCEQVQVCKAVWCCCLQINSEDEEIQLNKACLVLTERLLGLLFLSHDFTPDNQDTEPDTSVSLQQVVSSLHKHLLAPLSDLQLHSDLHLPDSCLCFSYRLSEARWVVFSDSEELRQTRTELSKLLQLDSSPSSPGLPGSLLNSWELEESRSAEGGHPALLFLTSSFSSHLAPASKPQPLQLHHLLRDVLTPDPLLPRLLFLTHRQLYVFIPDFRDQTRAKPDLHQSQTHLVRFSLGSVVVHSREENRCCDRLQHRHRWGHTVELLLCGQKLLLFFPLAQDRASFLRKLSLRRASLEGVRMVSLPMTRTPRDPQGGHRSREQCGCSHGVPSNSLSSSSVSTEENQPSPHLVPGLSPGLKLLSGLNSEQLEPLFLKHIALSADEDLKQVLWLSVVLYKSPEVELTCLLLLSTNAAYFLLEDSASSLSPLSELEVLESADPEVCLSCCLSIPLSQVLSVNVGLFDQYFRILGSSGDQVVCCLSRDSYATSQFLQELMLVLSLQQRAPPPEPSEQDFYSQFNTSGKMQNYELVHSRVKFIYPSEEEMGDLTFIVAERKNGCSSSSRSFNILLYLLVFQVQVSPQSPTPTASGPAPSGVSGPAPSGVSGPASSGPVLQPRTLILTSTDVFLLDEDYVSYPLPDFAKEPPSRERYHLCEARRIRDLDRVLLGYQTYPQALTLVFDELPGPDLLCPLSMDHFSASLATPTGPQTAGGGACGEVQWCVFVPSADSRERLISLLARQWEMLCSRELPVELTG